jgi:hypothetical protein
LICPDIQQEKVKEKKNKRSESKKNRREKKE